MKIQSEIKQVISFSGAIKALILSCPTDKPDHVGNILIIKTQWENRVARQLKIKIDNKFTAKIHSDLKFIIPYNYIYTIYIPLNTQIRANIKNSIVKPIQVKLKIKVPLSRGMRINIKGRVRKPIHTRAWWYGYSNSYNDPYHTYYGISFSSFR